MKKEIKQDETKQEKEKGKRTRPDTRPTLVACGWAGAEMRIFPFFKSIIMDQQTDGPTDGWKKPLIELRVRN